ncbi:MAG: M6 family metalloprotease domain-containing protein [Paraprevotella sp.]|nr:M6 family metalloprotease domain-containing protein [Paraprevotella sp.]
MIKTYSCRVLVLVAAFLCLLPVKAEKNKGKLNNLVCFVRFLDEDNGDMFEQPYSVYEQLFNDATPGANSVYNYFREASYGQLAWKSSFFPLPTDEGQVMSYQASRERGYYRQKSSINEIGYEDEVDKAAREQALIREVAAWLSEFLPEDTQLDADGNGIIDNMCIVLSGRSDISNKYLLWPHRSDLALPDEKAIYIKGKKLVGYLMVFDDANGWASLEPVPLNTGVICHEMSHSLGTYDLYHVNDNLNPVGVWDLMADNLLVPQQMSAYTKYRYCGWLDEIPEITEEGTYVLNPLGGETAEKVAYKIKPVGSEEYFVVEYRRKENSTFDAGLPESGLLVYRINPAYTGGNLNYNGTTRLDEVYVFRPGGTVAVDGNLQKAAFSAESGRTAFGGNADVKPFYSDGTVARFSLNGISACGETLSFNLEFLGHQIKLSEEVVTLEGEAGRRMEFSIEADVDWVVSGCPEWLKLTPMQGKAGKETVVMETLVENDTPQTREAEMVFTSPEDASLKVTLAVHQLSNIMLPPADLTARPAENGGVVLAWTAPKEGAPLLSDGFEDVSNPNGWTIRNAGDRGWGWQESSKYYLPYKGNYSLYMKSAWEDVHQDEWLVSPVFANGRELSFWSKSIAPQKNINNQYYYVEVSTDGGETWTPVYDLVKDCQTVNQYVKITVDLSAYQSERMRVAFHAYDTDNMGLSYWWQIDEVNIYSVPSETLIEGYAVYRNGTKLGETAGVTFTDTAPLAGENRYTVRAFGQFGETSDSEEAVFVYDPTGIVTPEGQPSVTVSAVGGHITVRSSVPLDCVRVVTASGMQAAHVRPLGNTCEVEVSGMVPGLYLVVCESSGGGAPCVRKVFVR